MFIATDFFFYPKFFILHIKSILSRNHTKQLTFHLRGQYSSGCSTTNGYSLGKKKKIRHDIYVCIVGKGYLDP